MEINKELYRERDLWAIEIEQNSNLKERCNIIITETRGYIDNLEGREKAIRVYMFDGIGEMICMPVVLVKKCEQVSDMVYMERDSDIAYCFSEEELNKAIDVLREKYYKGLMKEIEEHKEEIEEHKKEIESLQKLIDSEVIVKREEVSYNSRMTLSRM